VGIVAVSITTSEGITMDAESMLLHVDYSIRQLREFANVSRALDGLECVREALLWELRWTVTDEPAERA
jgi:hypothetical protein